MAIEISKEPRDERETAFHKDRQFAFMLGALVSLARQICPDKVVVSLREQAYYMHLLIIQEEVV